MYSLVKLVKFPSLCYRFFVFPVNIDYQKLFVFNMISNLNRAVLSVGLMPPGPGADYKIFFFLYNFGWAQQPGAHATLVCYWVTLLVSTNR